MKVGYVRVSTIDQNLDLQIDALKSYGCEKIFQDKLSGVKDNRPGLEESMEKYNCPVNSTTYIYYYYVNYNISNSFYCLYFVNSCCRIL
ncbi:recombinase family protein, partial [Bacillus toyonensis]|uniref:recombinase family protein n=1 Tax=Bacillus toyonensis TaxID=155322 RepID=UPI001155931E